MLSFSSCEAKKGSRDLDFSDMKKLRTYFKMGTFLATFEQFSVQFCKKDGCTRAGQRYVTFYG